MYPIRSAAIWPSNAGETLGENRSFAVRIATAKSPHAQPDLHRHSLPWQILELPEIVTVPRS
jgi:hypothetical protein